MEEKVVLSTESKLPPAKNKKPSKAKKIVSTVLSVVWVSVLTVIVSASSQIIYNYSRYSSFFVNGESMYPTLNANVTYEGSWKYPEERGFWGDFNHAGTYICDYGLMDDKPGFLEGMKRFDVAVTYYPKDYVSGVLSGTAELKIKRLIGLPGETLYFDEGGELYVNGEHVEQTFSTFQKERTIYKNGSLKANYGVKTSDTDKSITLSQNQYFVVGDNRNYNASEDSRFIGPIDSKCIQGRAVALTASCKFEVKNGQTSSSIIWNTMKMPWDIKKL